MCYYTDSLSDLEKKQFFSFEKYLLNTYYVSSVSQDTWGVPALMELTV